MRQTGRSAARLAEATRDDAKDCTIAARMTEAEVDDAKDCMNTARLAEAQRGIAGAKNSMLAANQHANALSKPNA
jgi:hypothetical protein